MSYTYEQADNSELMTDGNYEATIEKIDFLETQNGKKYMNIQFRIRKDVNKSYGNKCVFEKIWTEKENPNRYNHVRINRLLDTQNVKVGTVFETAEDIKQFLLGKYLQLHIIQTHDSYIDKDINTISYYKKTEHPDATLEVNVNNKGEAVQEIADEELPF